MTFQPHKIIFHHTADGQQTPQFSKVDQWHKIQQFPMSKYGYYCGYHIFIERTGKAIIARRLNEIGAHTRGQNDQAYGIGLAGNFEKEYPTPEQEKALGHWCNILMKKSNIPITAIYPHRAFSDTLCPGHNVTDKFAAIAALKDELSLIQKLLKALQLYKVM